MLIAKRVMRSRAGKPASPAALTYFGALFLAPPVAGTKTERVPRRNICRSNTIDEPGAMMRKPIAKCGQAFKDRAVAWLLPPEIPINRTPLINSMISQYKQCFAYRSRPLLDPYRDKTSFHGRRYKQRQKAN